MYAAEPGSAYPAGSFRPGRVIWAKVEGHDWWPARVVRRRAVPREVGPPPGGPLRVRTHIPVVFFTAKGIPGEVGDDAHKLGGNPAGEPSQHHCACVSNMCTCSDVTYAPRSVRCILKSSGLMHGQLS